MPTTAKNSAPKASKAAQVARLRVARAARKGSATKGGKVARTSASAPAAPRIDPDAASKPLRNGTKLDIVVKLLKRPNGCTAAQVCDATGWAAVSIPPIARRAGIKLTTEKVEGVTHYRSA